MITQKELQELLHYSPETGVFTWRVSPANCVKVGDVAGNVCNGYIRIRIRWIQYHAHRLAWLYVHGHFPPKWIDHINCKRADNRLANLRLVTPAENALNQGKSANNTSGYKGVSWSKSHKKWMAMCQINGNQKYLGRFDTAEKASSAYQTFSRQQRGEFFNGL